MKEIPLFILFIIFSKFSIAQGEEVIQYTPPQVILPSPDAYSLGKFGEFPVNKYSGSVSIDIPIYNIEMDGLSIPISLSYHPNGMRVEELASWVGQGWALNAGGLITRTVVGLPDQLSGGGYLNNDYSNYANITTGTISYQRSIHTLVKQGVLDLEPDKYNYNILGNSGSLFIVRQTGEIQTMPKSNLKFRIPNVNSDSWEVKDAKGNTFLFGGLGCIETTHLENYGPTGAPYSYSSTLLLKKIITTNGKEIEFIYQSYENLYQIRSGQSKKYILDEVGDEGLCPNLQTAVKTNTTLQSISGARIYKIKWQGGEVIFNKTENNRQDILNDYALKSIVIINEESKVIKEFKLNHDYVLSDFGYPQHPSLPTQFIGPKRLFLKELTERVNDINDPRHKFFYALNGDLPYYLSTGQDHWGYNNNADNQNYH